MRTLATLATLALLTLAGCGGNNDDSGAEAAPATDAPAPATSDPVPAPEQELRAAVSAYSDAFLTGKGEVAYDLLSLQCQAKVSIKEFGAVVEQAGQLYGTPLPFTSYSGELTGARALVTYGYQVEAINQADEPWVLEQGSWRNDDC
jgi:hypothetical protein